MNTPLIFLHIQGLMTVHLEVILVRWIHFAHLLTNDRQGHSKKNIIAHAEEH